MYHKARRIHKEDYHMFVGKQVYACDAMNLGEYTLTAGDEGLYLFDDGRLIKLNDEWQVFISYESEHEDDEM